MTQNDIERKQEILINFLKDYIAGLTENEWLIKAEYSTNDNDKRVIVVQEQSGQKIVFFDKDTTPLFNYYMIDIYGLSIQECKNMSLLLNNVIGNSYLVDTTNTIDGVTYNEKWQLIFKQMSNPRTIQYMDIRRVSYSSSYILIVNKVASKETTSEEE